MTVPNPSHTPRRTVRVPDDVWETAAAKAERHGETLSDVVRDRLEEYARPRLMPGDTVHLTALQHGADGLYVIEEGPTHGAPDGGPVTLRRVEP